MSSPSLERAHLLAAFNHQSQLLAATIVLFEQAVADQLHISVSHIHCANLLRLTGPMTAGQLAELTGLTTGAVTSMIDRLERAGYVRRESDPHDRRRVFVHAEGEAMERDIGPLYTPLANASAALNAHYSDQELALLVDYLTRNNALTLDEAVNLRHAAAQATDTGIEIHGNQIELPLGSLQAGHLVFATGSTRLSIGGNAAQHNLLQARFEKLAPSVLVDDGLVKVFYRHALLNWSANTADVQLNSSIPWRLDLLSSGAPCTADLRSVPLSVLDIHGKASNIELTLPRPTANVPIRIAGNASNVVVRYATDTAIQVRQRRGEASLMIDGQDHSTLGSKPYYTPNYAQATARYDIEVTARLTTVTLEPYA